MIQLDNISNKELAELCSLSTVSANVLKIQCSDGVTSIKGKGKYECNSDEVLNVKRFEHIIFNQDRIITLAGKILTDLLKQYEK